MKIGDKVRFLNAVGGGRITAFQDKDIVLVCDDDGFEVPTLRSEVVVVETDNYNFVRPGQSKSQANETEAYDQRAAEAPTSIKAVLSRHHAIDEEDEEQERDLADLDISYQARPIERSGGEQLNLHLGFLPLNSRQLSTTRFEAYLINDSNRYVRYLIMTQEGTAMRLRHEGLLPPNQKAFLEEFSHDALPDIERLNVQVLSFKTDKTFAPRPPHDLTVRIDGTKFYKLHTFQPSDFFDEPALVVDLVRDDQPAQSVAVDAQALQAAMTTPAAADAPQRPRNAPARTEGRKVPGSSGMDRNAIVEVDLHASALLDSTAGLEPRDILTVQLRAFHETMKAHAKDRGRRIVFIHGKGEGVLRQELLKELKRYYPQCTHQDASFREYGFGATMVTVR